MTTPRPMLLKQFVKFVTPVAVIGGVVFIALSVMQSKLSKEIPKIESETGEVEIKVGSRMPDFTLNRFHDGEIQASQLKSKVIMVNFWATWCEPCMVEMPSIVQLRKNFQNQSFEVAAINVDENPEAVLPRAMKRLGIDFPIYTDVDAKLAEIFNIQAIPFTLMMDQSRKVLMIENGERDWNDEEMHSQLKQWLAG